MFMVASLAFAASSVALLTIFGKRFFADRKLRAVRLAAVAVCMLVISVGSTGAQNAAGWCRYCDDKCPNSLPKFCQSEGCGGLDGCEHAPCNGVDGNTYIWRITCDGAAPF